MSAPRVGAAGPDPPRAPATGEPAPLLAAGQFRRLLVSRFAAQWGDGAFQAGLGGAVLFNPERQADPAAIAIGLAVLLLPYSLVGPFAGALLDRWDRRQVLVVANLLRAGLIVAVAVAVGAGVAGAPLYTGALLVTGVSRFVLAGLSASLPHVVGREQLVEANALAATVGAAVAAAGGGCAIALRAVVGSGDTGSAWVTASAVAGSLAAALVAAGFRRNRLGPDETDEPAETVAAVLRGLRDGLRAAAGVRSVAAGLVALAAHRLSFGIATLVTLLLYRHTFTPDGLLRAGLAGVGQLLAAGAAGVLLAAVLTPLLVARVGRRTTIRSALLAAAVVTIAFGLPMVKTTTLAAAFGLACAGQVVKLSLDAAVQRDVGDVTRGRVFALYDTVFNVGYVLAVALAATVVPDDGRAPGLLVLVAVVYLIAALAHAVLDRGPADRWRRSRRAARASPEVIAAVATPGSAAPTRAGRSPPRR
ncbi:MAG: MFS transporter [Pseudonocardiaceae bacterium]|nr:MFS transporter [Pseudonocardiaceae bacterium]